MLAELPECQLFVDGRQVLTSWQHYFPPPSFLPKVKFPDIVIVDHSSNSKTVLFETNITKCYDYKTNKYSNLMHNIAGQGYKCTFLSIAVGS